MSTSIKPLDLNWALHADLPKPDFVLPGLEPEMSAKNQFLDVHQSSQKSRRPA